MSVRPRTALSLVDEELTLYCEASTSDEPSICRQLREAALTHPSAHWTSGPLVGTLLRTLVSAMQAQRVLDIGTFFGYSAAYMASANGYVTVLSLERDPQMADRARALVAPSVVGGRISIETSDAFDWLSSHSQSEFDLIFFDSNRTDVMRAYSLLARALRPGGILVMDNACLRRAVLAPTRPWESATAEFNAAIQRDSAFVTTLLPIRDGVLLAHKLVLP